ncbi:MAG TPA: TonB family protein [Pyrinomonadaceae bacterium]|nr:TonB family protein [Pyrinomonadaceae bacterium]
MKRSLILTLLVTAVISAASAQKPKHPGIVSYEQARYDDAIRSLSSATKSAEHKADADIWNALGLAYMASGAEKKAIKAFEKSVDLAPQTSSYHANLAYAYTQNRKPDRALKSADKAISLDAKNPHAYHVRGVLYFYRRQLDLAERDADAFMQLDGRNPQAYLLKSEILVARLDGAGPELGSDQQVKIFAQAAKILRAGVENTKGHPKHDELVNELDSVVTFQNYFERRRFQPRQVPEPAIPDPTVTPVKITYQPKAMYTDEARSRLVMGAVRVAILLGASGKVEGVLFLSRLGFGLDQQVLKAARAIKFEPRMKDGKPVSVVVVREYTFSIY